MINLKDKEAVDCYRKTFGNTFQEFYFNSALLALSALNSINRVYMTSFVDKVLESNSQKGRNKHNLHLDYISRNKALFAMVSSTKKLLKEHTETAVNTARRTKENDRYQIESDIADLLDYTDEEISPLIEAVVSCTRRIVCDKFPLLIDKDLLADAITSFKIAVFNEMIYDVIANSYPFMKKNAQYTMLRMHKLREKITSILRIIPLVNSDGTEPFLNVNDIFNDKVSLHIMDDLTTLLMSSEFMDKIHQNINHIDPKFRLERKSMIVPLSDITLPLEAYRQRYSHFDYDKFSMKYVS